MLGIIALARIANAATDWIEQMKLDGSNQTFGVTVSVTYDRLVIGGRGKAWKFVRELGGTNLWIPSRVSFYPAAMGETTSVATYGDLTLVATSSRTTTYELDHVRTASLPGGRAVAVSGNAALIATEEEVYAVFYLENSWRVRGIMARYHMPAVAVSTMAVVGGDGEVHSYLRVGTQWIERDVLREDAIDFGAVIAIDDAYMVVGAFDTAFIYRKTFEESEGLGIGWSLVRHLGKTGEAFGSSVAVANGIFVIGAPLLGAAYVTEIDGEMSRLVASDAQEGNRFGEAVGIEGYNIVVGAPGVDAAYTYTALHRHVSGKKGQSSERESTEKLALIAKENIILLVIAVVVFVVLASTLAWRRANRRRRKSSGSASRPTVVAETRIYSENNVPLAVVELVAQQTPSDQSPQDYNYPPAHQVDSPTTLFLGSTFAVPAPELPPPSREQVPV